jgi:mono/diheme cytochrome c family protein
MGTTGFPTAMLLTTLALAGCAAQVQIAQPAPQRARGATPPGSVYTGWRVFQDKCATCHGATADGSSGAPDLLPIVRAMGPRQFVSVVLDRYDWGMPIAPAGDTRAAREAQVDTVLQRSLAPLLMPAWGAEPRVNAHIADLQVYLAARADGTQGPARPSP